MTVDTLRADRVTPSLTPVIDRVGASGWRFTHARTVAPLTLPAHVSLMTGTLPPAHGVRLNGVHRFDGRVPTLARVLRDGGYQTGAFVAAYVLDRTFGLAEGFDVYGDRVRRDPNAPLRLEAERRAEAVVDEAIGWLRERPQGAAPLFLWVHLYDPHAPYEPPAQYLEKAKGVAYDGEVAYADAQIGRLLDAVRSPGRPTPPLVGIVGDHGESLGEHGERTHGMLLYEAAIRIPLVISGPGVPRAERREAVSLVDLAPTLLRLAGVAAPPTMRGDLVSDAATQSRPAYSETEYPRSAGWSALTSLADERWKLIESNEVELFDLTRDAGEATTVADRHPAVVRAMSASVAALKADSGRASQVTLAPEAADRLRALGYVASSATDAEGKSPGINPARAMADWAAFEDALALLNDRRAARAAAMLASLSARHPQSRVFQTTWARALQESGRPREALERYRQAVATWPGDATLYHDLAVAARAAGRADEAARAERAALASDDRYAPAHNGLGLLAADRGQHAEARSAFERATQLDGSNAGYWVNLGNACRAVGDLSAAERAYRQASTLDPTSPDAANGLGVLLVQANRPVEAIALFERAVAARPDFFEAWLNLGIANQEAGRPEAARDAYRRVLEAPPTSARERRAARELLGALRPSR